MTNPSHSTSHLSKTDTSFTIHLFAAFNVFVMRAPGSPKPNPNGPIRIGGEAMIPTVPMEYIPPGQQEQFGDFKMAAGKQKAYTEIYQCVMALNALIHLSTDGVVRPEDEHELFEYYVARFANAKEKYSLGFSKDSFCAFCGCCHISVSNTLLRSLHFN